MTLWVPGRVSQLALQPQTASSGRTEFPRWTGASLLECVRLAKILHYCCKKCKNCKYCPFSVSNVILNWRVIMNVAVSWGIIVGSHCGKYKSLPIFKISQICWRILICKYEIWLKSANNFYQLNMLTSNAKDPQQISWSLLLDQLWKKALLPFLCFNCYNSSVWHSFLYPFLPKWISA